MINRISSFVNIFTKTVRQWTMVCFAVMIFVNITSAQTPGKISGTVTDATTGEVLMGCNIILEGTKMGAATDADGSYYLINVSPGKYNLKASMIGYQAVIQQDVIVNSGKTTKADFVLKMSALIKEAVIIQATRPDVEKEKTSTSTIIRADDVAALAGMRDVSDVIGMAADVSDGHFRGGREGEELYTLQGMGLVNPLNSTTAFMPIMSAVEEVEVVTSGFGAQYGNAQSGVVNITMKEGKADKWRTTGEFRQRMPTLKHFGSNVYDPSNMRALSAFLQDSTWLLGTDPENPTSFFGSYGIKNVLGNDTLVQLAAAKAIWLKQTKRDLNRKYGNEMDYSFEATAGGPLSDKMRMFLAFRSNVSYPTFPTEEPDKQRQIMGNLVYDLGKSATLRLIGGYAFEKKNTFPSYSALGFYNFLFDRIQSINYEQNENYQLGLKLSHALSQSTFYEIKLNTLTTYNRTGSTTAPLNIPDSLINFKKNQILWSYLLIGPIASPEQFTYMNGRSNFENERTQTISLEGSMTSQVNKSHLLNGGLQFNRYKVTVNDRVKTRTDSGGDIMNYTAEPYELGVYVQDKMEFEGMISNVGLRVDMWNTNSKTYTNTFEPYKKTLEKIYGHVIKNDVVVLDSNTYAYYNPDSADSKKAPIIARLQPRVGISFPVTSTTVFHANYGSFLQRPSFQYSVSTRVQQGSNKPVILGNPRLEPQVTYSYDLGVMQGLGEGFTLDVSGYYKDVKNLIESADFTSYTGLTYTTYFNRDNADIRGFRIALSKKKGNVVGSLTYHYSVATGKSATSNFAAPVFTQDSTGAVTTNNQKVPARDALLSFDRTHNVILNLAFVTDEGWGPSIFGYNIFEQMSISTSAFARSGRPYTSPSNPKLIFGARTPAEYNLNLKLVKRLDNFLGVKSTWYCEVFNVFNNKILNYNYIFAPTSAISPSTVATRYESVGLDDPNAGIRYWNENNIPLNDFAVDQLFMLYSNSPRSFNFGVSVEL